MVAKTFPFCVIASFVLVIIIPFQLAFALRDATAQVEQTHLASFQILQEVFLMLVKLPLHHALKGHFNR